jgi:hypothetical protein
MTRDGRRLSPREYSHASGLADTVAKEKRPAYGERAEVLVGKPKFGRAFQQSLKSRLRTFQLHYVGTNPLRRHFELTVRVTDKTTNTSVVASDWEINLPARKIQPSSPAHQSDRV